MSKIAWVEEWLNENQVPWEYDESVPLHQFDVFESLANQARLVPLDEETVEAYAADMARGDEFPAAIARKSGSMAVLIGGNHRVAAAMRSRLEGLSAYLIDCDDPKVLRRLAVEDNRRHGLPLPTEDRLWHAADLVRAGDCTQAEAAELCGLSTAMLTRHLSSGEAGRRALRLGVDGWQELSSSTRARLASIDDDQVFTQMIGLCASGAVKAGEVAALIANVNHADSTDAALERLSEVREANKDLTRRKRGRPPAAARMPRVRFLMDLDPVLRHGSQAVVEDCENAEDRKALKAQVLAAAAVLREVLAGIEAAENTKSAAA